MNSMTIFLIRAEKLKVKNFLLIKGYHQLSGLSFGPSSMGYNTSAHLYNLFSPNSISSLSPNPDLHSPYPRVSSLPTPYASSNSNFFFKSIQKS